MLQRMRNFRPRCRRRRAAAVAALHGPAPLADCTHTVRANTLVRMQQVVNGGRAPRPPLESAGCCESAHAVK